MRRVLPNCSTRSVYSRTGSATKEAILVLAAVSALAVLAGAAAIALAVAIALTVAVGGAAIVLAWPFGLAAARGRSCDARGTAGTLEESSAIRL
jgi:hypothetical protein